MQASHNGIPESWVLQVPLATQVRVPEAGPGGKTAPCLGFHLEELGVQALHELWLGV